MDMSHAPTLSLHYSHYLFHSSYTTVLVPLHCGLCTIFSYFSSTRLILFYTVPTSRFLCSHAFPVSDTVHALPVFYLRYSPPPLYHISRQYTLFYPLSSFGLRVLGAPCTLVTSWISQISLSVISVLCPHSLAFPLSSPGLLPDLYPQLAH